MKLPPLSLYVHLPWCVRKCPYCDFNSHTAGDAAPKERYINALLKDIARESASAEKRELKSIFLGGGTPSLFSPAEIGRVLDGVRERFAISTDVEITMEANPGTVAPHRPGGSAVHRAADLGGCGHGQDQHEDERGARCHIPDAGGLLSKKKQSAYEQGADGQSLP